MPNSLLAKLTTLLEMIKFSHTVFAFPFALMGVVLASLASGSAPTFGQVFWICLAMVGARTGAMGLNRIIDARIDAENPRTADRHLPAGKVRPAEAWLLVLGAFALFLAAAWMLNPLCLKLAPVAIFFLALYSFCKRFTAMAHVVLGVCLAAAPVGAWIALRGDIGWPVMALGAAVLFWVAGFDIFYALQDYEHDRDKGLFSIPSRFGVERSFLTAQRVGGADQPPSEIAELVVAECLRLDVTLAIGNRPSSGDRGPDPPARRPRGGRVPPRPPRAGR